MRAALSALAIGLFLIGCDGKSETGMSKTDDTSEANETGGEETGGEETGEPLADCTDVPAEACGDRPDCLSVDGRPTQAIEDGYCVEYGTESTTHDCHDKKGGCGDIPYLAAPASSPEDCWWFPNTCIPEGWVKCGGYEKWEECPPE